MGEGYFTQACGIGGVVRIGGIKRGYSGAGFFEYLNRRLLERVGGFRGSNQAFCAVRDFAQAGNIAGSFHVGYDSFELPGIRRAQSFQYALQLFIVQDDVRAAAFQVVGYDAALSFHYAAIRTTDEFQKIQADHLMTHVVPSFSNEGVVKAGYGVLRNVIDELSGVEVDGAIDAVFEKGTAAGAQVAVGVDNKLAIVFVNTADADIAVGGYAVAVGVGNVVVAIGGEDFCAGEVEFFNKVFEFVFRRDGAKLHAEYRICFVQFLRKFLSQGLPYSYGNPIKKENGCRGSQQDNNFYHSDNLCVTRKPADYNKTDLFTNHDNPDYCLEVASRILTKVNLSYCIIKDGQDFARLCPLCLHRFSIYERIEQEAARLSGSLPEDQLVWFRSSFEKLFPSGLAAAYSGFGAARGNSYDKRTSSFFPSASAYLRNVFNEGDGLPVTSAFSNRATAVALVPMRSATCAWVSPASLRALRIASNIGISSRSSRSTSAFTAGLDNILSFVSAYVMVGGVRSIAIFNLLHPGFSNQLVSRQDFLRFFDEAVQHHNTAADQRAIEHARDTFRALQAQFKQAIAKSFGMRLAKIWPSGFHPVGQSNEACSQRTGQVFNLNTYRFTVKVDAVFHGKNNNIFVIIWSKLLTPQSIQAYPSHATAKSVAGIGLLEAAANGRHVQALRPFSCLIYPFMGGRAERAGRLAGAAPVVQSPFGRPPAWTRDERLKNRLRRYIMTNTPLVPVFTGTISNQSVQLCNARDLHQFLEIGTKFADWINGRIKQYGFIQGEDYFLNSGNRSDNKPGRGRTEYHLTLDMAKELAMVENNDKGRQIRRYFISLERRPVTDRSMQLEEIQKAFEKQYQKLRKRYDYPRKLLEQSGFVSADGKHPARLNMSMLTNTKAFISPLMHLLNEMRMDGHDVSAPWDEFIAMREALIAADKALEKIYTEALQVNFRSASTAFKGGNK